MTTGRPRSCNARRASRVSSVGRAAERHICCSAYEPTMAPPSESDRPKNLSIDRWGFGSGVRRSTEGGGHAPGVTPDRLTRREETDMAIPIIPQARVYTADGEDIGKRHLAQNSVGPAETSLFPILVS